MDIQISSNFERLLFSVYNNDGAAVSGLMDRFKQSGDYAVDPAAHARIMALFAGDRSNDDVTKATMKSVFESMGHIVDPHTAIGIHAARVLNVAPDTPIIALGTAHPAKFPDAIEAAIGQRPALPGHLADLLLRPERFTTLANNLDQIKAYVRQHARQI